MVIRSASESYFSGLDMLRRTSQRYTAMAEVHIDRMSTPSMSTALMKFRWNHYAEAMDQVEFTEMLTVRQPCLEAKLPDLRPSAPGKCDTRSYLRPDRTSLST